MNGLQLFHKAAMNNYICGMKMLMVCLGNICRSPMAEGILQHKAKAAGFDWIIDSAGTNGLHNGEHPHHLSQKICKQHNIDISHQVSRKVILSDFDDYDLIFAMSKDVLNDLKEWNYNPANTHKISLFLEQTHPGKRMDVPDPWYGNEDGYIEVYGLIEAACEAIITSHKKNKL